MSSSTSKASAIKPRQTMRGHTERVNSVVHLPDGRRIMTYSLDGSLRLWDLESGAQIGKDWRDENTRTDSWFIALSPDGRTIARTGKDGDCYSVGLWDFETRKIIAEWTGHVSNICALCWSADGERVASAFWDGTARIWDVDSRKTMLSIKTGHEWMRAVMYSPDSSKLATGGDGEDFARIWDAKTGELLNTPKHDSVVSSLGWTSDGQKLISGSFGSIRIFDTATWEQIAILEGHTWHVYAISLSPNNRLLTSASFDKTARLWNLDTNLQVGPPLHHEQSLYSAALSPDGKVLVTACENNNAYAWDVYSILKEAGTEDLLSIPNVPIRKPLLNKNATGRPPIQARRIPQGFFDGVQNGTQSSTARGARPRSPAQHPRSTRTPLLERFSSLFLHSRSNTDGATQLQRLSQSIFSHHGPRIVEVPTVQDRKALFVARPAQNTQPQAQPHGEGSSTAPPAPGTNAAIPGARPANSRLVRLLAHLVLFLCCASPQHASGNAHPTQQQSHGQAQTHVTSPHQQGQPHAQASSSQTQPAASSTSTTPIALGAHTTVPGAASGQPRPLPLRTRFVLFLCCTALPHADGY